MQKFVLLGFLLLGSIQLSFSQCQPDPEVIALGDPEGDGVLNPWFLEVHPGQVVDETVTVLAPPDGEGAVVGITVPYTMNFFTVKRLDNMPSWVNYECPDSCKFLVNQYSCVHVTGIAPMDVPIGDSTVMDVIVDANVDATVLFIQYNGYEVEDENGGTLTIRYVEDPTTGINASSDNDQIRLYMDHGSETLTIDQTNGSAIKNLKTSIYSLTGRELVSAYNQSQIHIGNLPKGIYLVQLQSNDGTIHKTVRITK